MKYGCPELRKKEDLISYQREHQPGTGETEADHVNSLHYSR